MGRRLFSSVVGACLASIAVSAADPIMVLDFTKGTHGWTGNQQVQSLQATPEGLAAVCTGDIDPWLEGPSPPALPIGQNLRLTIRMRSDGDSGGELFYGPSFVAGRSVRFEINPDGEFHDYLLRLPALGEGSRLRIDPGGTGGNVTVAHIRAQVLQPIAAMEYPRPDVSTAEFPHRVESGPLVLRHTGAPWHGFRLEVGGEHVAEAMGEGRIGYRTDQHTGFLRPESGELSQQRSGSRLVLSSKVRDRSGGTWRFRREFEPLVSRAARGPLRGAIRVTTEIRVDRPRDLYHLPWVTLFAGLGSAGTSKMQALLPGVEYLADEPSSSEADVTGAKAIRRMVDDIKVCMPMMSVVAAGRYVGLSWSRADHPAPVFDSPDRVYGSDSHLMGLWHPSVGVLRDENSLQVYDTFRLEADTPLRLSFVVFSGAGNTVVPAVQHWLAMNPAPPIPELEGGLPQAVDILARGWLDSDARVGPKWRHAVWGDRFRAQPAADAAAFMQWLAARSTEPALASRLDAAAAEAVEAVDGNFAAAVSHVPLRPLAHLLYGDLGAHLAAAEADIRRRLETFPKDGTVRYRPGKDRPDYGKTHFADHANGLGASALTGLVEYACWSGNREIEKLVLKAVDRQTALYVDTVPRGAQTWEMPLHTPDILASGRLVHIYVLSYLISGDPGHLEQARYWAWTGVPFLYLDAPVDKPVGLYATTAVLGATNWQAPYWIGLPVQWCGLVYRSALLELAQIDPADGPLWRRLADGMTRAGLQMTWPATDSARQGLLPDFYHLRAQRSDGPAINPGTVQAGLAQAYGLPPMLDVRTVGENRIRVLAPGRVVELPTRPGELLRIRVDAWPRQPYDVHLAGLDVAPAVTWTGDSPGAAPRFVPRHRCLTVRVRGTGEMALRRETIGTGADQ